MSRSEWLVGLQASSTSERSPPTRPGEVTTTTSIKRRTGAPQSTAKPPMAQAVAAPIRALPTANLGRCRRGSSPNQLAAHSDRMAPATANRMTHRARAGGARTTTAAHADHDQRGAAGQPHDPIGPHRCRPLRTAGSTRGPSALGADGTVCSRTAPMSSKSIPLAASPDRMPAAPRVSMRAPGCPFHSSAWQRLSTRRRHGPCRARSVFDVACVVSALDSGTSTATVVAWRRRGRVATIDRWRATPRTFGGRAWPGLLRSGRAARAHGCLRDARASGPPPHPPG